MRLNLTTQNENPNMVYRVPLELIVAAAPECGTGGARPLVQAPVAVSGTQIFSLVRGCCQSNGLGTCPGSLQWGRR